MGMFSTQDAPDTRFVSIWLETEAGEFVASMGVAGSLIDRYEAEPTPANLQVLCRHLGKSVWTDTGRSKTPFHTAASAAPVPIVAVQYTAHVGGKPLRIRRIRVTGLKLVVDVASGEMRRHTLGTLTYDASTAKCDVPA